MKNCDYWKKFINTGKIDDYLSYIACAREEYSEEISFDLDNNIINNVEIKDLIDNTIPHLY